MDDKIDPKESARLFREMRDASDEFYRRARKIGVHAFIEHAGLMNEHIKVLEGLAASGIDPRHVSIHGSAVDAKHAMKSHHGDYLAEKFGCIFAAVFSKDGWNAFKRKMEHSLGFEASR